MRVVRGRLEATIGGFGATADLVVAAILAVVMAAIQEVQERCVNSDDPLGIHVLAELKSLLFCVRDMLGRFPTR